MAVSVGCCRMGGGGGGGTLDQGVLNQLVNRAYTQIANDDFDTALNWMLAFGVDAIIVNDKTSQEVYHDYADPRRFAGRLPVLLVEDGMRVEPDHLYVIRPGHTMTIRDGALPPMRMRTTS